MLNPNPLTCLYKQNYWWGDLIVTPCVFFEGGQQCVGSNNFETKILGCLNGTECVRYGKAGNPFGIHDIKNNYHASHFASKWKHKREEISPLTYNPGPKVSGIKDAI